jgi:hypothetical protein
MFRPFRLDDVEEPSENKDDMAVALRARDLCGHWCGISPRAERQSVDRTGDQGARLKGRKRWGDPITHASVCRDSISLDLIAMPEERRGTGLAYIQLSGVDAYFSELQRRALDLSQPGNRPYGMRDFEVVETRTVTDLPSVSLLSASGAAVSFNNTLVPTRKSDAPLLVAQPESCAP